MYKYESKLISRDWKFKQTYIFFIFFDTFWKSLKKSIYSLNFYIDIID